ncbi:gastric triacylglycerol lipase-like [Erinaceus europaeus]|uniref:Lipase n=1 Tax=Erinaceus europaeus TaxID=9365 RepID=A0ABM3X1G1_ERIEU|nr:gastric triacylglycerol lipase-like [Erinaceus europaeus]
MRLLLALASLISALGTAQGYFGQLNIKNPEANMNISQMISYWGYPSEEHEVLTADGYVLTVNRIPHGKKDSENRGQRPVVYLQHGFLTSATNWISNLPNNSLGFILADAGYDVWMGNSRGNTWSRRNLFYSPDTTEFWAFSFDEMAEYDIPATINFILQKTGQEQISYVGHSQGASIGLIAFSTNPKLAKKVTTFYALAPGSTLTYTKSILGKLSYVPMFILRLILGNKMLLSHNFLDKFVADQVCSRKVLNRICSNTLFLISGFDAKNLNMSRLDIYLSHNPAGSSVQDLLHWCQVKNAKKFQAYDWGSPSQNMIHYNQPTPPVYNMTAMEVPIAVWSGGNDWLADPKDINLLLPKFPNLIYHKEIPSYNHLDFIWAINSPQEIYNEILSIMVSHKS